jgi:hypothetical protein
LKKKKQRMRSAIDTYSKLVDYQVGEVTAAATYYIAEIYFEFNVALIESERPTNLSADELEEYELVIEDQAYPFEEKAISVHEKNMELLDVGIYNEWVDKSIAKLAVLLPARYAKTEQSSVVLASMQPGELTKKEVASAKFVKEKPPEDKDTDNSVGEATPVNKEVSDKTVTLEQSVVASDVASEPKAADAVQTEDDALTDAESGDKQ